MSYWSWSQLTAEEISQQKLWGVTNPPSPYRTSLGELMLAKIKVELESEIGSIDDWKYDSAYYLSGFFKVECPRTDPFPRKFCLVCGHGSPRAVTGEWYHWTEHPSQCPGMKELAIKTIQLLISSNHPVVCDFMSIYPVEFKEACARLLHEMNLE